MLNMSNMINNFHPPSSTTDVYLLFQMKQDLHQLVHTCKLEFLLELFYYIFFYLDLIGGYKNGGFCGKTTDFHKESRTFCL